MEMICGYENRDPAGKSGRTLTRPAGTLSHPMGEGRDEGDFQTGQRVKQAILP
jgi:hypothetical protein